MRWVKFAKNHLETPFPLDSQFIQFLKVDSEDLTEFFFYIYEECAPVI